MGEKLIDSNFLNRLERLSLDIQRLINMGSGGNRKSKARGSSLEFSDFREYNYGDDLRRIDWNAYGRLDRLFIKLFMEEREALVNVFIDSSKSMDFGSPKKSRLAQELAAAFSYISLVNMDRVSLNVLEDKSLRASEIFGGRGRFERLVSFIEDMKFEGRTNLAQAIKKKSFRGGGLSIIISDFFTEGKIEDMIKYLVYNKQDIILIDILSPEEQKPKLGGSVKLKDIETGEEVDLEMTAFTLEKYDNTLKSFINEIQETSKKYGAVYINVLSDASMERILFQELIEKRIVK